MSTAFTPENQLSRANNKIPKAMQYQSITSCDHPLNSINYIATYMEMNYALQCTNKNMIYLMQKDQLVLQIDIYAVVHDATNPLKIDAAVEIN